LHLAVIVAVGLAAYWNSLGNPFIFDDRPTIVDNPFIRSFTTFWQADKGSALTGRPIVGLTFALNYAVGGLNVLGYRLVNIGLHLACALLLYGVVRRTLTLAVAARSILQGRLPWNGAGNRAHLDAAPAQHRGRRLPDAADRIDDGGLLLAHDVCRGAVGGRRAFRRLADRGRRRVCRRHAVQGTDGHRRR
jgi:hypothetical protein